MKSSSKRMSCIGFVRPVSVPILSFFVILHFNGKNPIFLTTARRFAIIIHIKYPACHSDGAVILSGCFTDSRRSAVASLLLSTLRFSFIRRFFY